jgi:uncharacterized protein YbbK (DUF523 family)
MHKVLVSACLLGQPVRYDGQSKGIVSDWLQALGAEGRALAFCPEVAGGLPTRAPCRAARRAGGHRKRAGCDGRVRSGRRPCAGPLSAAGHSLRPAEGGSPSCGSGRIYNGRFEGVSLAGEGKTTALLRRHGIAVFSEDQLPELASALALAACGSV